MGGTRSRMRAAATAGMLAILAGMVDAPKDAHAVRSRRPPAVGIAVQKAHVTQVWATVKDARGRAVRGQGVLVGIVDSGIDYRNPDFTSPDGKTRITVIWDQSTKGKAPAGFSFGNVCTSAAINNGTCSERDVDGHGTHVAGIAAGNGRSSSPAKYPGVANMANIAVVKLRGTEETDIVDACRFLIAKAKQLHEPVVINLSLGHEDSPHDGSSPEGKALSTLTGPGRIIVAAAGNESLRAGHAAGTVREGETIHLPFTAHDVAHGTVHLYYPVEATVSSRLVDDRTGQTFAPGSGANGAIHISANGAYRVAAREIRYNARWEETTFVIAASRQPIDGPFALTVAGEHVARPTIVNVWSGGSHIMFLHPDRNITISTPADVQNIISVANYTTRVSYQDDAGRTITFCALVACPTAPQRVGSLDPSSSWGPTTDGREKPDLAAPGGLIASSRSGDVPTCRGTARADCVLPQLLTNGGRDVIALGTSMAAPMVTGTVALMLQVRPQLAAQKARQILRATARHDSFTGKEAWSPQWGAGKLDALAAVRRAKALR